MDVRRMLGVALVSMIGLAGAAGCAGGESAAAAPPDPAARPLAATTTQAQALTVTDPWLKTTHGKGGMTAAFATLVNSGNTDITVVSAVTLAAPKAELHESVQEGGSMVMRAKQGGFSVPAKGTLTLEPGGNHIMLLDVEKPVKAGDEVRFTLKLQDGSVKEFTALGKDFAGANESYRPGGH